jgi:hypothetical protein
VKVPSTAKKEKKKRKFHLGVTLTGRVSCVNVCVNVHAYVQVVSVSERVNSVFVTSCVSI